ncbi:5' nucleotidase, NT5C type [Nocardia brasiliensis]|uniref:5' nucleotidase, NT5C type n=1 Tax=Nocardia brasiliensis TaxID=37326 RepID=UPI00245759AF|nr:hypothetical protein [Nocardia brasiliensis]
MARVLIDIDDVLYPFIDQLRQYLFDNLVLPLEAMPEPTCWEFADQWGITAEDLWAIADEAVNFGLFRVGDPLPGAAEGLRELRSLGHTIHIATARFGGQPGVLQRDTVHWLNEHGFPYDSLTFTADKALLRCDYAIDDRVKNYRAMDAAGIHAVLMDRPWNQDDMYNNRRVTDIPEFVALIKTAEAAR